MTVKDQQKKLISSLKKAKAVLKEAVEAAPTVLNKNATIQSFEVCFELSWKLMQETIRLQGLEAVSPKNSIRTAAQIGIIDNPSQWIDFSDERNLTTHTYNEDLAEKVYQDAKKFLPEVEKLLEKVENINKE